MNQELTDEELLYASPEDWAFYIDIIQGLPTMAGKNGDGKDKNGDYIPYGSGPHIIRHFKDAISISKPRTILEIGLNCGVGSALLLSLSDAYVFSVDISDRDETIEAATILAERFPNRFGFNFRDKIEGINPLGITQFDLAWIDGGHEEEDVTKDIQLCKQLKIPYLLLDDIYSRFGPGVLPSIAKFPELELVKDMNNLRLYRVNY